MLNKILFFFVCLLVFVNLSLLFIYIRVTKFFPTEKSDQRKTMRVYENLTPLVAITFHKQKIEQLLTDMQIEKDGKIYDYESRMLFRPDKIIFSIDATDSFDLLKPDGVIKVGDDNVFAYKVSHVDNNALFQFYISEDYLSKTDHSQAVQDINSLMLHTLLILGETARRNTNLSLAQRQQIIRELPDYLNKYTIIYETN